MSNTNRTKGHNAERFYANIFREMGYIYCKTTRESSKLLDNCKVDLDGIPFSIQIKAGTQKGLNASKIFFEMEEALKKNFPPEDIIHTKPKILIHHKQGIKGKSRNEFDNLVMMTFETFKKIINNNGKF